MKPKCQNYNKIRQSEVFLDRKHLETAFILLILTETRSDEEPLTEKLRDIFTAKTTRRKKKKTSASSSPKLELKVHTLSCTALWENFLFRA